MVQQFRSLGVGSRPGAVPSNGSRAACLAGNPLDTAIVPRCTWGRTRTGAEGRVPRRERSVNQGLCPVYVLQGVDGSSRFIPSTLLGLQLGNRGGNPFHPTCKIGHLDKEPGLTWRRGTVSVVLQGAAMSLDCILGGIHSRPRSVCVLGVIFALVCFVPVADVSQPDPLSIAGIYDAADGDDAVQAATSLESPPRYQESPGAV